MLRIYKSLYKFVRTQKFQNVYMHNYLYFKSRILVPDVGP